ncbi:MULTISPECIES: nitrate reductase molybdenum cofactor assembly chaperone [unclassified Streptomyces]|uniref:nitrate reductase molybdenum cofactor assembly chaperone n=1 Tax=unclassified Streptomyces TaxID=2593676 RepID=UPI001904709B|nr:molecular chaperone TorD family protein [Streptomyces sp. HSG2]
MPGFQVLYQAAALCLTYPDDDFRARLPLLREAAPQLRAFTDHAVAVSPPDLQAHYTEVFLDEERHSLRLSRWSRDDDGGAARRFAGLFEAHGLRLTGEQPPDFLPAVLELTSRTGDDTPLLDHRDALVGLRGRLQDRGTPYACVLEAVCATLPPAPPSPGRSPGPRAGR